MGEASIHRSGLVNPNWPLCVEVDAMSRGWTTAEVEDGELADDPLIAGDPFAAEWFPTHRPPRPDRPEPRREP